MMDEILLEFPEEIRSKVENLLYQQGYRGKYPDFIKSGEVRGLYMQDSHGMSYFIFNEKNAVFHIHCRKYPEWNDTVQIEFLFGKRMNTGKNICGINNNSRDILNESVPAIVVLGTASKTKENAVLIL